jgi:adenine-specific DNA-methyltransferase
MNKQDLLTKIKSLDGISQDERAYLINLVNTKKKYGLVWEDKPEVVEEQLRKNLPVLREVVEKRILSKGLPKPKNKANTLFDVQDPIELPASPNHILIEGDNLHALTALTFTHEGKIDVMYFDPPYNTGSKEDFIYNDHYVDKEDAFRHSKWLSFMGKRLKIAKRLLANDGVLFCSIGDDEIAQLTLLFNEIFGEENKLGVVTRVAKTAGDMGNYFAPSKDYILVYTKNISILSSFKDEVDVSLFKKVELDGPRKGEKYRDDVALYQAALTLERSKNARYFITCPDGTKCIPPEEKRWRVIEPSFLDMQNKGLIVFKRTSKSPLFDDNGQKSRWNLYTKSYLKDREVKGSSPRDFFDNFINRKAADLIKQYDIDFNFSKPYELIQHLIRITNKPKNIKILDFFAGSGTTLHSTICLNDNDNGNRMCILVTNDENNICENITYPRCFRILTPYTNSNGKEMPFFSNNNLRYFRCEFVNRDPSLNNKRELTKLATELLCIKENCYTEQDININQARLFSNDKLQMLILYDDITIPAVVDLIKSWDSVKSIKLYVFSMGSDPYTEDFAEVLNRVELCALPDAIYKAYQNVLPKKNKLLPVIEEETGTPTGEMGVQLNLM